jgi:glutaminase
MEIAENELLDQHGREKSLAQNLAPKDFILLHDFTPEEIAEIEALLKPRSHLAGETVLGMGELSTDLLFLKRGKVSVLVENSEGQSHRVATYSPGMAFGEVAFLDRSPRSAIVKSDTDIECAVLQTADFDDLTAKRPTLAVKLLRNLAIEFSHTVRRNNNALRLYSR